MKCLLLVMVAFLWAAPSFASDDLHLAEKFDEVCQELEIPKPVVLAIARVESNLNPWVLNIEGRSWRFNSKAEALARAREAWQAGRSFDVGLMQVNRWWLTRYNISLEAALDPLANIYLGGWILKQELRRHKDLRKAIGAYHSPDPHRARRYADQVLKALGQPPAAVPRSFKKTVISSPIAPAVSKSLKATDPTPMKVRSK